MIREDEDRGVPGRLSGLTKLLMFATTKKFGFDEDHEELLWFDSPAQAVASMDATFGRYLPPQFSTWDGMQSDKMTAMLCVYGVAAWYLTGVRTAEQSGHEVPEGANLECNLGAPPRLEPRPLWPARDGTDRDGP